MLSPRQMSGVAMLNLRAVRWGPKAIGEKKLRLAPSRSRDMPYCIDDLQPFVVIKAKKSPGAGLRPEEDSLKALEDHRQTGFC